MKVYCLYSKWFHDMMFLSSIELSLGKQLFLIKNNKRKENNQCFMMHCTRSLSPCTVAMCKDGVRDNCELYIALVVWLQLLFAISILFLVLLSHSVIPCHPFH
jgi:hypothetical protein